MPRILYITTELPFFPGQGGLMAVHVRHLATSTQIGVVGPTYPDQPADSLKSLRDTVRQSYWWPEPAAPGDLPARESVTPRFLKLLLALPTGLKRRLLRRLAGIDRFSNEALAWRMVLVNLAPKILEALDEVRWNSVLLTRSSSVTWLRFLPATVSKCIYLHDIRSDYLSRAPNPPAARELRRIKHEDCIAMTMSDSVAFVSELDRSRAAKLLPAAHSSDVAPICVDLDYFKFEPASRAAVQPVVLFTGHLSHPPNIDAIEHLLVDIWPAVVRSCPDAKLRIVGIQPSEEVEKTVRRSPNVELVPNAPDIRPHFREARVLVVPMRFGGGIRQKIVEAWAAGIPVVTTTMGAEGLEAKDAINCWLRDDPAGFANKVIEILGTPPPTGLTRAARCVAEIDHAPNASCPRLETQLKAGISRRRSMPPKVLFDLRWLVPGKVGGVEQMAHELIDELADFDREFEYRIHGPSHACRWRRFRRGFKCRIIPTDDRSARWRSARDAAISSLAADLSLPPITSPKVEALETYNRLDFTVVHGLPSYVHPDLRRFPNVVTVHDLQHLHHPEFFSTEDVATREVHYRESCRLADHVICVSEFTRQDVHRRFGVPLGKMTTVWNLPPRLAAVQLSERLATATLRRLGISRPFLFYPAQPWPHKNHLGLLEAMKLAAGSLRDDMLLVFTGQPLRDGHPAWAALGDPVLHRRVIHLGYRSPLEVAALFSSADALIMPSLFEGFGIPVLEAMQHGCPVVCGAHTALPEIAGDAALFTDVSHPGALAEAIVRVTRDDALRSQLREAGRQNLMRFDRKSLAERTRAIYADVHERHFS